MNRILFVLSLFFVLFSFSPSLYEIYISKNLPPERVFVLEHNYMFDYNFYVSRIREGQPARNASRSEAGGEGRWLVVEKYYNQPHQGSLFQIVYLLLGKLGGLGELSPPAIYHLSRLVFGFILLVVISRYALYLFPSWWGLAAFLFIVTSGSWPILVKAGNFWRSATYMGWWSAIDSLQRITFIPHVLIGQIFILVFIWRFSKTGPVNLLFWGVVGFVAGIIFPPTLIVVYTFFGVISVLEWLDILGSQSLKSPRSLKIKKWFWERGVPRLVFGFFSLPALIYLQLMVKIPPWSALPLFDIQHRMALPYLEYMRALGPVLPLGIFGMIAALFKNEKKLQPLVAWVLSVGLLFLVFERVPTQSPLRFTEAAIHIPLGILAAYFFYQVFHLGRRLIRAVTVIVINLVILMGLGVMLSMVFWLTDQAKGKQAATWQVPIGAQLGYPLKDFMDGVYFIRDNIPVENVILGYVTAGNFIPAYAGNYVYIGHANTPDEDGKEKIAAGFFSGKMEKEEAKEFLKKERISFIFFGPQERELGRLANLESVYPFVTPVYNNRQVIIYKIY